jgi:antitoxin (DNA-binding transcriptional repressor) of toxin-antitoxin stability system
MGDGMDASILDLRYKTRDILKALENREPVVILYHGKPKGTIVPLPGKKTTRVCDHQFFGMRTGEKASVKGIMSRLRSGRHDF